MMFEAGEFIELCLLVSISARFSLINFSIMNYEECHIATFVATFYYINCSIVFYLSAIIFVLLIVLMIFRN